MFSCMEGVEQINELQKDELNVDMNDYMDLFVNFSTIVDHLSQFKMNITQVQQEIKTLEKRVKKQMKGLLSNILLLFN